MADDQSHAASAATTAADDPAAATKWRVVGEAIKSWPTTLRLCLIIFVLSLPTLVWLCVL